MRRSKLSKRTSSAHKSRLFVEMLEDRTLLSNGQWLAVFGGITPGDTLAEEADLPSGDALAAELTQFLRERERENGDDDVARGQ